MPHRSTRTRLAHPRCHWAVLIALHIFLAGPLAADSPSEIVQDGLTALAARDADTAIALLSSNSRDLLRELIVASRSYTAHPQGSDLSSLRLSLQFFVRVLAGAIAPADLSVMSPGDLASWALARPEFVASELARMQVAGVRERDQRASVSLQYPSQVSGFRVPIQLSLVLEEHSWKLELESLLRTVDIAIALIARSQDIDVQEMLGRLVSASLASLD